MHTELAASPAHEGRARHAAPPADRTDTRTLHILALSAKSGGGHDGTANALRHLLEAAWDGEIRWQCLDVYGSEMRALPWMARIRNHCNWLWALFLRFTEQAWVLRILRWSLRERLTRSVVARITDPPDLVIATHFAGAQILEAVSSHLPTRPATAIVATDYRPHRAWFAPADILMVSRESGLARASQSGEAIKRIIAVTLLPCLPTAPRPAADPKRHRVRVVAVMGAEGTSGQRLARFLQALSRKPWSTQLDLEVVCGHNERMRDHILSLRLAKHPAGQEGPGGMIRLTATGYVTDLPQRLACADLCLMRASPLAMTEALAAGTPILAFDWHPHEAANAQLLERWECGWASKSIPQLVAILQDCVRRESHLLNARVNAGRLAQEALRPGDLQPLLKLSSWVGELRGAER